jgi:polyketide synthase PksJ
LALGEPAGRPLGEPTGGNRKTIMTKEQSGTGKTGLEVAVIGMAGRFPGAGDIRGFWENVERGVESIAFSTEKEQDRAGVSRELRRNPNYVNSKGGVMENREGFDAAFFEYTSVEAEIMDPQFRVFHQEVWHVLEDAGYDPNRYEGRIGLYAGATTNLNWYARVMAGGGMEVLGEFAANQLMDKDFLCSRVAYRLNLRGPAVLLQTACSTSLVAVHMACRGLMMGESDIAVAGGVSAPDYDNPGYVYQQGMIQSADGHCRAFDRSATGTVGGSGVAVLALKRLKHAEADGDHIYAIIKGTAINNDGAGKVGYNAPGIDGQAAVIKAAHRIAKVEPGSIGYIEAHGTGTTLGDPVEIKALNRAFGTEKRKSCAVGSVKANIGHLDAAAGAAGLIKAVLALYHRKIPPSINYETPNPDIDFDNSPFYVNRELTEWKPVSGPLRAGVSSFGIGGTNAHVVLEEAPEKGLDAENGKTGQGGARDYILPISAKTGTALEKMTLNLAEYIRCHPGVRMADVAFTLQEGRSEMPYRRFIVAGSSGQAAAALADPGQETVYTAESRENGRPVIFMFPGQGSQYINMGRDLYRTEPVFRREIDRCFEILETIEKQIAQEIKKAIYPETTGSDEAQMTPADACGHTMNKTFLEVQKPFYQKGFWPPEAKINRTEIAQPLLYMVEYAMACQLRAWGIEPYAVIGHSLGEYVAAVEAGIFSPGDALRLVVKRGRLMQRMEAGAMLGVTIPERELDAIISENLGVSLAAVNSTGHSVISGLKDDIARIATLLEARGYRLRRLHTSHAYHSAQMEPMQREYEAAVAEVTLNKPQLPIISNISGTWFTVADAQDPAYWSNHVRRTVRYADGLSELMKQENVIFLEVGPGKALTTFVRQHAELRPGHSAFNLMRHPNENETDTRYLYTRLGQLWLNGVSINWKTLNAEEPGTQQPELHRVPLPTYPFEEKQYRFNTHPKAHRGAGDYNGSSSMLPAGGKYYVPVWRQAISAGERVRRINWHVCGGDKSVVERLERALREQGHRGESEETMGIVFLENTKKGTGNLFDSFDFCGGFLERLQQELRRYKPWDEEVGELEIVVVTADRQDVIGGDGEKPGGALAEGLLAVLPHEYPKIRFHVIDVRSGDLEQYYDETLRLMAREIPGCPGDAGEDNSAPMGEIAIRNGRVWRRQLEPLMLPEARETGWNGRLREKGVYMITGGHGKIGLTLAKELTREVKAKVVLVSRGGERDEQAIREIVESGGEVMTVRADVADEARMREVFPEVEKRFGPVNGIFHTAGTTTGKSLRAPLAQLTKQDIAEQRAPKVEGLRVLEVLLEEHSNETGIPVDFLLATSSLAAETGGVGMAAYAAANREMDARLEQTERNHPRRRYTVNFDGWDFYGDGNDGLTPAEGIEAIRRVLAWGEETRVIVSAVPLEYRVKENRKMQERAATVTDEFSQEPDERPKIATAYKAAQTQLERQLTAIWQKIFGFAPGINDDFFELGGDSLKAMTVVARIQAEMGVEYPLADFFNKPTIAAAAKRIETMARSRNIVIEPTEKKEYYQLSAAQKRLYVLQQLDKTGIGYNLPQVYQLEGKLEFRRLNEAFQQLVQRHESLRTTFRTVKGRPCQQVHPAVPLEIETISLETVRETGDLDSDEELVARITCEFIRPFDLAGGPLIRVGLIRQEENRYILMIDMHHIVTDGNSHRQITRELQHYYGGKTLEPLTVQYRDYAQWENRPAQQEALLRQGDYWRKQYNDGVPRLELPIDKPRPPHQQFEGRIVGFELSRQEKNALETIGRREGTTRFMEILALYNILLAKITGREDIVVGTIVNGRKYPEQEEIIGVHVNTLALRHRPEGNKTFREFLRDVKTAVREAFAHRDFPFDNLVQELVKQRDMSRNPVFDVGMTLDNLDNMERDNTGEAGTHRAELQINTLGHRDTTARCDLFLHGVATDKIHLVFQYSTALFEEETVKRYTEYYIKIVTAVIERPDIKIKEIAIHSEEEIRNTREALRTDREAVKIDFNF